MASAGVSEARRGQPSRRRTTRSFRLRAPRRRGGAFASRRLAPRRENATAARARAQSALRPKARTRGVRARGVSDAARDGARGPALGAAARAAARRAKGSVSVSSCARNERVESGVSRSSTDARARTCEELCDARAETETGGARRGGDRTFASEPKAKGARARPRAFPQWRRRRRRTALRRARRALIGCVCVREHAHAPYDSNASVRPRPARSRFPRRRARGTARSVGRSAVEKDFCKQKAHGTVLDDRTLLDASSSSPPWRRRGAHARSSLSRWSLRR